MTTIPADVLPGLRGALYHQLGGTAEDLAALSYQPPAERLAEWSEPIARFDRARALLDRVGWVAPDPEQDVDIDLDRHRRVLADALANELVVRRSLASEPGEGADIARAGGEVLMIEAFVRSVGVDVVHEPEQQVTVPEDFLGLLTESVQADLREAAEAIEVARDDVELCADALERLDADRALLDALGWGTVATLDVDPHRDVLARALAERLELERGFLADAERSRAAGAEDQHQRAYRYALQIESFMETIGMEIPAGEATP
jgi:hypothetical protein